MKYRLNSDKERNILRVLITGEYLVLDGGLHLHYYKFGQNLIVEKTLIIKFTGKALTLTANLV
jgi:hypothetical protein